MGGSTLFGTDTLEGGAFAFTDKNAGIGNKTVTTGNVTVNDGNSGNNYNVTYANNTTSTINKANLTVAAVANTKTYDGTVSAAALAKITAGSLVGGDTATLTETYVNKNAGSGKTLTPTIVINDCNSGNNYNVTLVNNTNGTINKANLTVAAVANTKTYDGTVSAAALAKITAGSLVGRDTATLTETYVNKNAGSGKTLTPTVVINDGNSGNNYNVTLVNNTNGTINKANLTIGTSDVIKTYDGTTTAAGMATAVGGSTLFGTDTLTGGVFAFTDKNAGINKTVTTKSVTVNDGNSGKNYNVTYANNTTSTINKALLIVTANNDTKKYDGKPYSGGNGVNYDGFVNGEKACVLGGHLTYGGTSQGAINKGTYTITPGGLTSGNYTITFVNGMLTIVPKHHHNHGHHDNNGHHYGQDGNNNGHHDDYWQSYSGLFSQQTLHFEPGQSGFDE